MRAVKVKLNMNSIRHIKKASNMSLMLLGKDIKEDLIDKQVIPYRTGATQESLNHEFMNFGLFSRLDISNNTWYSPIIYYNTHVRFRTLYNSNAQALWFRHYFFSADLITMYALRLRGVI